MTQDKKIRLAKVMLAKGDMVQKGLVKCLWRNLVETGISPELEKPDLKYVLEKCAPCHGFNYSCKNYDFNEGNLNAYTNGKERKYRTTL